MAIVISSLRTTVLVLLILQATHIKKPVMNIIIGILIGLLSGFAVSSPARAQSTENAFVGARPLALGGAFTAVADDANAMFFNPAGLHSLTQHQFSLMNSDLYGTGIQLLYLSYVFPMSNRQALGVDWQHIGFGDEELEYGRNLLKVAFSRQLYSRLSVGSGMKFLFTDMALDKRSVGKGLGAGFDLGLLISPIQCLRIGIDIQDINGTKVRYDGGGSETILPTSVRVGMAWEATKALLLAADVDRKFHLGGEYDINHILSLRLGAQKDLQTADPLKLSFGLGLKYKSFQIDFSQTRGRLGLMETQYYGFSISFDPSPHLVKVIDTRPENILASYFKLYSIESAGSLTLQNKHSEPLEGNIRVKIPEYSEQYTDTPIILAARSTQTFPFRLVVSDAILNQQEDQLVNLDIRIEYPTKRARKTIRRTVSSMVFRPGSITWDTQGKAAAFITHEDPVVTGFARGVYRQFPEDPPPGIPVKVYQAILIFDALSESGLRYVEDPQNPFNKVLHNQQYVDRISYPRETLRQKTGDCDDDVVLYCALLESLNIATGMVEPEGHIFMMFDTGYTVMDDEQPFVERHTGRFFEAQDGKLWIPVEVTLLGSSFEEAWKRGVEQMQLLRSRKKFAWIQTREAWQRFAPVIIPGEAWEAQLPSKNHVEEWVQKDLDWVLKKE